MTGCCLGYPTSAHGTPESTTSTWLVLVGHGYPDPPSRSPSSPIVLPFPVSHTELAFPLTYRETLTVRVPFVLLSAALRHGRLVCLTDISALMYKAWAVCPMPGSNVQRDHSASGLMLTWALPGPFFTLALPGLCLRNQCQAGSYLGLSWPWHHLPGAITFPADFRGPPHAVSPRHGGGQCPSLRSQAAVLAISAVYLACSILLHHIRRLGYGYPTYPQW